MDIRFTRGFTLQEVLEMVYAEDGESVTDIFITPPDFHKLTDEDSGETNEPVTDNCSGRQLRAETKVRKPARKRYYWASKDDMRNHAVYNAMRRDRFFEIMRFLHFQDNNKFDPVDILWKLRSLIISKTQQAFASHFVPEEHMDFEKCMIKYYGHHGCKQLIRRKPTSFGYQVWSMNTKEGYLISFEVYQEK
ncbi:hypothetical protein ILUMI_04326 [Ignelater luminosus]|uniref:PiggyBac transposable element-derived protein domain-containing protein n=1 Tax=Ignelater luminosus TaxID=2038154 RepID=A0A8K0GJP3_IGNLU|nr:hypothetical protein ILUMI_04326 [Ignelater luminosus]